MSSLCLVSAAFGASVDIQGSPLFPSVGCVRLTDLKKKKRGQNGGYGGIANDWEGANCSLAE